MHRTETYQNPSKLPISSWPRKALPYPHWTVVPIMSWFIHHPLRGCNLAIKQSLHMAASLMASHPLALKSKPNVAHMSCDFTCSGRDRLRWLLIYSLCTHAYTDNKHISVFTHTHTHTHTHTYIHTPLFLNGIMSYGQFCSLWAFGLSLAYSFHSCFPFHLVLHLNAFVTYYGVCETRLVKQTIMILDPPRFFLAKRMFWKSLENPRKDTVFITESLRAMISKLNCPVHSPLEIHCALSLKQRGLGSIVLKTISFHPELC